MSIATSSVAITELALRNPPPLHLDADQQIRIGCMQELLADGG